MTNMIKNRTYFVLKTYKTQIKEWKINIAFNSNLENYD